MAHQIEMLRASQVLCLYERGIAMSTAQLTPECKKGLAVWSALISLLFLISGASSASAISQHGFSIKVFTSPDDQFWTNSVILEGAHEVMLVDAQLTRTNAERVLQQIADTRKPLAIIYITHEHADHY